MNNHDIEIISKFNSEIRGIYNYYRLAQNISTLDKFTHIMGKGMYKTLAGKYRTSGRKKIAKGYKPDDHEEQGQK